MKKIILLIIIAIFITGCMNIKESSYDQIINTVLNNEKITLKNKTSQGYSYYLPTGINVLEDYNNNAVLKDGRYTMYLYLDLISFHNKVVEEYQINPDAIYSTKIANKDKFGYLEINLLENNKNLIEIMYNYAKIEVIVDNKDVKTTLAYAISILSSISYNETIIANMIGEDTLNYSELEFNIFETAKNESNLIQYDENNATSEQKNDVPDMDLIN